MCEGGDGLVEPIWTVCMYKILRCAADAELDKDGIENVATLLNMLSRDSHKVLADLVKKILQDQGCTPSF